MHAPDLPTARAVAAIAVASVLSLFVTGARADAKGVHIRGIAYEFNNSDLRLAGATIRVAEQPRLHATTEARRRLRPRRPRRHDGHPIHQRGRPPLDLSPDVPHVRRGSDPRELPDADGRDLRRAGGVAGRPLQPDGELRDCAIVSTFSTRNVRDLSFRGFTAYGAHGVAGATAFADARAAGAGLLQRGGHPGPGAAALLVDGGVVWTRVPAGSYRIRARHPSTRFASFVATCAPGRVVNADPPWGLHELGKPMTATVSARWSMRGSNVRLRTAPRGKVAVRARPFWFAASDGVARSLGDAPPSSAARASTYSMRLARPS